MISTNTSTVSAARVEMLCVQVEHIFLRLVPSAATVIEKVIRPALDANVLRSLRFLGIDRDGLCSGLLRVEVDWAEHKRQSAVCGWIDFDGHWVEDVSPQIRSVVDRFKRKMRTQEHRIRCTMSLDPSAEGRVAGRRIPKAVPCRWAGPGFGHEFFVEQLEELRVQYALLDIDEPPKASCK